MLPHGLPSMIVIDLVFVGTQVKTSGVDMIGGITRHYCLLKVGVFASGYLF